MIEVDEGVRVRDVLGALRSWNRGRGVEPSTAIWFQFPGDRIDGEERGPISMLDQEVYEDVKHQALKQEADQIPGMT